MIVCPLSTSDHQIDENVVGLDTFDPAAASVSISLGSSLCLSTNIESLCVFFQIQG